MLENLVYSICFLDEDKAIVTDVPGTTRDIIEGSFTIGDLTLHLMDTAGIHQSLDIVEKIGIERSTKGYGVCRLGTCGSRCF